MRCAAFSAVILVASTFSTFAADQRAMLIGRWRSENMPVGYWVIDRYSDGRLAKKEYMRDSDKPAEVMITWGRWKLHGHTYAEFFEGTTSQTARVYNGKWWEVSVQRITPSRFYHFSSDGHDTFEDRFSDRRPLLEVQQPPPRQYDWKTLIDTVTSSRATIPLWVNSVPETPKHLTNR
jgi:hypothetical protein